MVRPPWGPRKSLHVPRQQWVSAQKKKVLIIIISIFGGEAHAIP
jgi:hypothetical protein